MDHVPEEEELAPIKAAMAAKPLPFRLSEAEHWGPAAATDLFQAIVPPEAAAAAVE